MSFGQPEPIDVGHVKTIYGRDPEGNLIEISRRSRASASFVVESGREADAENDQTVLSRLRGNHTPFASSAVRCAVYQTPQPERTLRH